MSVITDREYLKSTAWEFRELIKSVSLATNHFLAVNGRIPTNEETDDYIDKILYIGKVKSFPWIGFMTGDHVDTLDELLTSSNWDYIEERLGISKENFQSNINNFPNFKDDVDRIFAKKFRYSEPDQQKVWENNHIQYLQNLVELLDDELADL